MRLGFGFFHSLLGFSRALGPSFRAFLTLLVDHLLAAQQFDEGLVGAIAFIPPGANNPKIATVTVAETRTDSVEQLVHRFTGLQVSASLPARRNPPYSP